MLSIMLNFAGCIATPPAPSSSPPLSEKEYNIEYFTDRSDVLYEYEPETTVAFAVTTEQGTYHFSDNELPVETVYEYVNAFEAGVKFANEWFGQSYDTLRLYFIQRDFATLYDSTEMTVGGSGVDGVAWVEYDYSAETPLPVFLASHVLMHETIHALCDVHSETTNFPRRPQPYPFFWTELLEEGLATMLEHLYGYHSGKLQDVYMYHYTQSGYELFESPLDEVNNVAEALDHLALIAIEEDSFYDELPYDILQSYYTSASFLYYLYEHDGGGKENLRRVYADINLMEEIYGKDMEGMIEQWLKYLDR
jgi:hypothetical protein